MNRLTDTELEQEIPVRLTLRALLRLAEGEPAVKPLEPMSRYAIIDDCLPAIGAPFKEGIYAGITLDGTQPMALILLPGDEKMNWQAANDWAIKQQGTLPTRQDALVLWQNVPKEFKETYYWTREEVASDADYAWCQDFGYGYQYYGRKSYGCRCRAVRRVAI